MAVFYVIIGVALLITYLKLKRLFSTKEISGGLHTEILLPHEKNVELYHSATSSCSQKVRTCLFEADIDFKSHMITLPSSGSYETKMPKYLRINPAGTVPVLVHNGHPIYESSDQIQYIDEVLRREDCPSLRPLDPEQLALMNKWIDCCSEIRAEVLEDPAQAFRKRVGNLLPAITIPAFAANLMYFVTPHQLLTSLVMLPFMKEKSFPLMTIGFKVFGLNLLKFSQLSGIADLALPNLIHHIRHLEADLIQGGGPWICGETFSLADVSWIPILERMEITRFWPVLVEDGSFKITQDYWARIQQRSSYLKGKNTGIGEKVKKVKAIIDGWKECHPWFHDKIYSKKSI